MEDEPDRHLDARQPDRSLDARPEQVISQLGGNPGGIVTPDGISFVAATAIAGLDPLVWLRCDDEIEMEYLNIIGRKMIEIDEERSKRNAQFIINALARSLDKGSARSKNQSSTA